LTSTQVANGSSLANNNLNQFGLATPIVGPNMPTYTPQQDGLFMSNYHLGFFKTGYGWNSFMAANGHFQFRGDDNNVIFWNGSTFGVRANQFILSTPKVKIDSVTNNGRIMLGDAVDYYTGQGSYMDGNGLFRVGNESQYMRWSGSSLEFTGIMAGNQFTATDPTFYGIIRLGGSFGTSVGGLEWRYRNTNTGEVLVAGNIASNIFGGIEVSANRFQISSTNIGFFGATGTSKPVVTGVKGNNAALISLIAALSNLGLIQDNTT
jgi:hypothetical protein